MTDIIEIVDELIEESRSIIDEFIKEEVMPILKKQRDNEKKLFDKAFEEVKDLEEG